VCSQLAAAYRAAVTAAGTCSNTGSCTPPLAPAICLPTSPGASTGTCISHEFGAGAFDAGAAVGPDGGESCDQLAVDFAAAIDAAMACTPGAPNQCQAYFQGSLPNPIEAPCGYLPYVTLNDVTLVRAASERWWAQCGWLCSGAIPPPPPPLGNCAAVDGSATRGICIPQ
jgi:hypothetical protein